MKRLLIIEGQMKQYRAPLFAKLGRLLCADGIQLTVAYSAPPASEAAKNDNCDLPPEYGRKVKAYWLWPGKLMYQPLLSAALRADLVILEQGNRYLLDHVLLLLSRAGVKKIALWGHGKNHQQSQIPISEWYRRRTLTWASWWFAYTNGTASYLKANGVSDSRITPVQNAVDTRDIRDLVSSLSCADRTALRAHIGIPGQSQVGIFCGVLEKAKSLPFLLESSRIIKARVPGFHLILVGGGPEQNALLRQIAGLDWIHWVGPKFGKEKAEMLGIADAFLLPGKVGLAILDAFAAGIPLITTRFKFHAPEIEYLEHDVNGLICDEDPAAFAEAVSSLFTQRERLARLQAGACVSSEQYSMEKTAENFRMGIRSCLGLSESRAQVLGLQKAS